MKCTSLFYTFSVLESESHRTAAAIAQDIHQAQAQTKAIACIRSRISAPHIAVPVSAVVQPLLEGTVLHITRIHGTCLGNMLLCRHIISGTGIRHCAVVIPCRSPVFNI